MSHDDGSLMGPGWKHVHEWPENAKAGPSRPGRSTRPIDVDVVEGMGRMDVGEPHDVGAEDEEQYEYETEEEEFYLTMDFGHHSNQALLAANDECQIIGLDTPKPLLKIGNKLFQGSAQYLVGSEMIFRDDRDPSDPTKHYHRPLTHTSNRMTFHPVELQHKDPITGEVFRKKGVEPVPKFRSSYHKPTMADKSLEEARAAALAKAMSGLGADEEESEDVDDASGSEVVQRANARASAANRRKEIQTAVVDPAAIPDDGRGIGKKQRGGRKKTLITIINADGEEEQVSPPKKSKAKPIPTFSKNGKRVGRPPRGTSAAPSDQPGPSDADSQSQSDQVDENVIGNPLLARATSTKRVRGGGRTIGAKNRPLEIRMAEKMIMEERRRSKPPRKTVAWKKAQALREAEEAAMNEAPGETSAADVGQAGPSDPTHFSADEEDDELMVVDE